MPRVVQEMSVAPAILALSGFDPPSYADLFVANLSEPITATPEQLARAAINGAPAAGRFLAFATFIRYDQPVAAFTWGATVSRVHRRVAPGFLGSGLSRLRHEQRARERG